MARITEMIRAATGGDRLGKVGLVQEFADKIGTTNSTVSRWRDGTIPGPQWKVRLAKVLKVDEDEIEAASVDEPTVTLAELSAKMDRILELLERRKR
jgi:transcriptional regulator with XRE-family HTH domain